MTTPRTIVVFGATGALGQVAVRRFLDRGNRVVRRWH